MFQRKRTHPGMPNYKSVISSKCCILVQKWITKRVEEPHAGVNWDVLSLSLHCKQALCWLRHRNCVEDQGEGPEAALLIPLHLEHSGDRGRQTL